MPGHRRLQHRAMGLWFVVSWLLSAGAAFGQSHLPAVPTETASFFAHDPAENPSVSRSIDGRSLWRPAATDPLLASWRMPVKSSGLPIGHDITLPTLAEQQQTYAPSIRAVQAENVEKFHWGSALGQSFFFLGIEHGLRLAFDPPSRTAFEGKFWAEYVQSIREIKGWHDGNPAFINYLGHPLQGSTAGFIQIQNDPKGRALPFGWSRAYWVSRSKALAWTAVYSTYFEIGFPFSEAAMGNLGVDKSRRTQQGMVDIVVTPTIGMAWLITEDVVDTYVISRWEKGLSNRLSLALVRGLLNPTRSFANLLRFKPPWHRDGRPGMMETLRSRFVWSPSER